MTNKAGPAPEESTKPAVPLAIEGAQRILVANGRCPGCAARSSVTLEGIGFADKREQLSLQGKCSMCQKSFVYVYKLLRATACADFVN